MLSSLVLSVLLFASPAEATGFFVHHHSPDAGASGAFILQKANGSIVYAGQGQTQYNIVRWYVPEGEQVACQQYEDVGPFVFVYNTGWHTLGQNWNSCVTQLA